MATARLETPVVTLTEPIQAWRTWTLAGSRDGSDVRPWPPRRPAEASCTRHRSHVRPELGCTCGLHAVVHPDELRRTRDPAVLGTVALWGTIVEHERGFRAKLAY